MILGSGRSGTSLAAGVLRNSGYFMGHRLNPANITNPKGQFEDYEINALNEALLAQVTPRRPDNFLGTILYRTRPKDGQRWLARIPLDISFHVTADIEQRIKSFVQNEPFCFKDPRFSYTLPAWSPFLKNTVLICVFRHPASTVSSILKQKKTVPHLKDFSIRADRALEVWELMYSHILNNHLRKGGDWVFLHYNQFFENAAYDRLSRTLGAEVDRDFADSSLNRSVPTKKVSGKALSIYIRLCEMAEFSDQHS